MATKLDDNGNLDDNWNDPFQSQKVQPEGLTDPTADALNGLFGPSGSQGQGITDPPMDAGGAAPTGGAPPADTPAAGTPDTGAAPLSPSDPNFDPNVNNPTTTWSAGPDSHPTSQYAGWKWDPNMFRYVKDAAGVGAGPGAGGSGSPVDFLQSLLAGGTSYQDAIKQYNAKYNPGADRQAAYYNTGGHNVIGLPDGIGGPFGGYFTDEGGWHFVPRTQREGGGGGAGGGNGNSGGIRDVLASYLQKLFGDLQSKTDANAPLRSKVMDQFSSLLDKYSKPVDENDPIIRANADAYHGIQARKLSDYGEMAANRAHSEGVGTGAFDSALGNATSSAGRDEAAYTGGLMSHELDNRRGALSNVINQGKDYLTTEDQQALADKLGTLTAGLGFNGQDNQDTQFYDQLAAGLGGQQNSLDSLIYSLLHRGGA